VGSKARMGMDPSPRARQPVSSLNTNIFTFWIKIFQYASVLQGHEPINEAEYNKVYAKLYGSY